MTPGHFFYIPFVFFLGFFVGSAVLSYRSSKTTKNNSIKYTKKTKGSLLAITFALFITLFTITHMTPISGGVKALHTILEHQPLFDQQTSSTVDEIYERIEKFGESGRTAYMQFNMGGDIIFPLSLLLFLIVLAYFVRERTILSSPLRSLLIAMPMIWFLSDMIENSVIYFLISQYPNRSILIASQLATITILKFTLLLGSMALPAVSYALFRNNEQNSSKDSL